MLFIIIPILFSCVQTVEPPDDPPPDYTDFTGEYLGQNPPGTTPVRFASDILLANTSWWWHDCPVFSPDRLELYFSKYMHSNSPLIRIDYMFMEDDSLWLSPKPADFSSADGDDSPRFSIDGSKLFFTSRRPGGSIFVVNMVNNEWLNPEIVDIPGIDSHTVTGISITRDETIYFGMANSGANDIYCSQLINGNYSQPENLGSNINTNEEEWGPYIDPDADYIIFASNRSGGSGLHDLYISFHNPNGSWTQAVNMGNPINSDNEDFSPLITFDGKYLFFVSARTGDQGYNPYWVDAQIIEQFRPLNR
jgi:Tol biopolymer transport system component